MSSSGINQNYQYGHNSLVPLSVRPKLLQYVEEHITSLIQDAVSIQRHTKRARLNPQVSSSLAADGPGSVAGAAASSRTGYFKTRLRRISIWHCN
jgi:hypothetical protein